LTIFDSIVTIRMTVLANLAKRIICIVSEEI